MKQIRYILLFFFAGLILLTSCKGFLGNIPKGFQIPTTVEEYEQLLNGENLITLGSKDLDFMTDEMHLPTTLPGEYYQNSLENIPPVWKNMYLFKDRFYSDTESDILYEKGYQRIFTYNAVIEGLRTAKGSESEITRVRSEAQIGRALEYLILVNVYSPSYDPAKAANTPSIPLLLTDDISVSNPPLATQEEVYKQISSDIESALPHLTEKPKTNIFRVSRCAAYALYAKASFMQKDYAKALKYANLVLKENNALLDMKPLAFDKNEWGVGARNNYPPALLNPESILFRYMIPHEGLNEYILMGHHLPQLFDTTNDVRFTLSFTDNPGGYADAPPGELVWNPAIKFNVGLSTPEIYLIAAECEARIGSQERALELLNYLRDHRIKEHQPMSPMSQHDLIKEVINERQREFLFRGFFRFMELKRLATDPEFSVEITHYDEQGTPIVAKPSSPKYLYCPLPSKVLNFRKN